MTADEIFDLRDRLVETIGASPEAWCAKIGLRTDVLLEVARETARNAAKVQTTPYDAAGTAFCMGFVLGAVVSDELLAERGS